jgi:hypothetical protein
MLHRGLAPVEALYFLKRRNVASRMAAWPVSMICRIGEATRLGSLPAGEGEPRCCGRGRRVLGGVREGPEGQPVQGLESDVVGLVYPPPPCGFVEIPKDNGGTRPLGIPTIADRVAQTVVKRVLEPLVEAGATVLGFGSQYPWTRRVYRTTHCAP